MKRCEISHGPYTNSQLESPLSNWEFANLFWPQFTKKGIASTKACLLAEENAKRYRSANLVMQGRVIPNVRR